MKDGNTIEILAPAGSMEQLAAAVNNGCDSVYLGLDNFNARMKAPNFTCENISETVDFCHLYGVKVYVTVNTSVKNNEFRSALQTMLAAYKANADGVIVTDFALLHIASMLGGNFDVVASTQLNCHDGYGVRFLKQAGATTVVCARECSLKNIKEIAACGVKVETFVHGALCVCQSGQCLMSSIVGGNSGNRGLCAQPCRNFYVCEGGEKGYLLSTADLDGTEEFADLLNSGATVFKIEGRNRSAEYASVCSSAFKQLAEKGKIENTTMVDLKEVYKRGNMKYLPYLRCDNGGIIYRLHPKHVGREVGFVKGNRIVSDLLLKKGDGLKIFDKFGNEVCGAVALSEGKNVEAKFSQKVSDGMIVCRTSSVALSEKYLSVHKTLDVKFIFKAMVDEQVTLTAICRNVSVTVTSKEIAQAALKSPTTKQEIVEQLQKTGNSYSTISDIVVETDGIFLAKSQINALRRQALDELRRAIISQYNSKFFARKQVDVDYVLANFSKLFELPNEKDGKVETGYNAVNVDAVSQIATTTSKKISEDANYRRCNQCNTIDFSDRKTLLVVSCSDKSQLSQAKALGADVLVYKPKNIDRASLDDITEFVYLDLPSFSDLNYVGNLLKNRKIGIVCHNVGHVQFAREHSLQYILGRGMNVFNDFMLQLFPDRDGFVYSYELTVSEIANFNANDGIVFVDGSLPLMQLVHCPYKVAVESSCEKCKAEKALRYTDERKNDFYIVRRRDGRCTFELFNGKKLSVCGKLTKPDKYFVDFDENVLRHYDALNNGIDDGYRSSNVTSGRLFNKIN